MPSLRRPPGAQAHPRGEAVRVYLLMYVPMQDDSSHVIAAFARREDAEATLAAMEAVPWQTEADSIGDADHSHRSMDIEGYAYGHQQWEVLWRSNERPAKWPPTINARIEEHEMAEAPMKVTPMEKP